MISKKTLYLASAVLLLVPIAAFAEIKSPFKQNAWDFSIAGSGSSDESFDNTGFSTSINLGYFFLDGLEGNLRQDITYTDVGDEDAFSGSTRVGADYHFGDWRLTPYLGATIGYLYGDNVEETAFAGPEGGLKYMLNPTTYVFGQVEYQILFDDDEDDGRFVYGLGLGLTFCLWPRSGFDVLNRSIRHWQEMFRKLQGQLSFLNCMRLVCQPHRMLKCPYEIKLPDRAV